MQVRRELMERLTALVGEATTDARLYPFGSSVSGLASKVCACMACSSVHPVHARARASG